MDGNGRWASAQGKPRRYGHRIGVEAVRRLVTAAASLDLKHLTIFAFSTENWRRPATEVDDLMSLIKSYVKSDLARLRRENIKVRIIGNRDTLALDTLSLIERVERETMDCDRLNLYIAFNYGGRDEIVRATKRVCQKVSKDELRLDEIVGNKFSTFLDVTDVPELDLLIRTGGEKRISNFLLWQAAYAELVFFDVLWPDFDQSHLHEALAQFAARNRRFGEVGEIPAPPCPSGPSIGGHNGG